MAQVRSWAGLDVTHAACCELRSCRLPGETAQVVEFCAALPGPTRAAYEAGPTGYGLARARHGHPVRVPACEEEALRDLVRGAQDLGGGAQATLLDHLGAIDTLELRRDQLQTTISALVPASPSSAPAD